MIDESLLVQLKNIGMSEYEAKIYAILSALRIATGREIHEQTKIPRGRVYETLASLSQKGFISSVGQVADPVLAHRSQPDIRAPEKGVRPFSRRSVRTAPYARYRTAGIPDPGI